MLVSVAPESPGRWAGVLFLRRRRSSASDSDQPRAERAAPGGLPCASLGSDVVTVLSHPDGDVRQFGPDVSNVLVSTVRQLLKKVENLGASALLDRNAEELSAGWEGTPKGVRDDLDHL